MTTSPCARCQRTIRLHARGLCNNCYKQHRDQHPRVRRHQPFTAAERDYICANWRKRPARELARILGRKVRDVYAAAVRFGVARTKNVLKTDAKVRARLVRLHAKGYSDREIAKLVGFGHVTVGRWLRRQGLPSNCRAKNTDPFPERTRQKQRRAALKRIQEEGIHFAVGFMKKLLDGQIRAVEMGWPQAGTLLEARILESLFERREAKLVQIVADVGGRVSWTGQVLRSLKNRGLVVVLRRIERECVYGLAAGVKKRWDRG